MNAQQAMTPMFKIRKGDMVMITTGKDKGKTGKVLEVDRSKQRVFVEKLNIIKRHMKPSQQNRQGGIIEKEASIHVSNVMIVCKSCGKSSRAGIRRMDDGQKMRYCKKCNEIIDRG